MEKRVVVGRTSQPARYRRYPGAALSKSDKRMRVRATEKRRSIRRGAAKPTNEYFATPLDFGAERLSLEFFLPAVQATEEWFRSAAA